MAWDHLSASYGTTLAPVMGPPSGVHQCRFCSRCTRRHRLADRRAALVFREVRVFEVREVLRLWLREGRRSVERLAGVDRKTVRRYVDAAVALGLVRGAGEDQLSDGLMGRWSRRSALTASTVTARRGGAGGQPRPDQGVAGRGPDGGEGPLVVDPSRSGDMRRQPNGSRSLNVCGSKTNRSISWALLYVARCIQ